MTQIKLRRDTSANFTSANPVLGIGEPAYETDTKKLKIGDGTTAYTQLEYFSAGGGGSSDITATLPLKIVDGIISLEVDGQTIQIVDGKLHANLDDKQDKFETQIPLSISSSSITTSVAAGITETEESWTGGGPDKLVYVNVSVLNIDANSDWKIHLSGYIGDYHATNTNTNALIISTENEQIFRVWFGSRYFRLGNGTNPFERIPDSNREFFYEIGHQNNGTEFTFNGTSLIDSTPLPISVMSRELGGQTPYTTLKGKGKLKEIAFVINSYQFQRIDKDISKSYFEADGVKYPITSIEGINTLKLVVGDGLSVVDGKLTASSTAPANMVTTDTSQTITGLKTFGAGIKGDGYISNTGLTDLVYTDVNSNPHVGNVRRTLTIHTNPIDNGKILVNVGSSNYEDIHTGNIVNFIDGTSITFTNNKLTASGGGSAPSNMMTTDTNQTITGAKTFTTELISLSTGITNDGLTYSTKVGSDTYICHPVVVREEGTRQIEIGDSYNYGLQLLGTTITDGSGNKFLTSGDKETIMGYIMPDYSTRTEVPWNTDNTAPTDGYVEVFGQGDGNTSAFILEYTINGVKTAVSSCYATSPNTNFRLPVICPKGTVYSARGGAMGHDLHFISMKGAV